MAALEIRKDRTPMVLRKLAKAESDTRVARRIPAIANALDGMSRKATVAGCVHPPDGPERPSGCRTTIAANPSCPRRRDGNARKLAAIVAGVRSEAEMHFHCS